MEVLEELKGKATKKIMGQVGDLLVNVSDKNIIRIIDIGEKFFIKKESTKSHAESIKRAFIEKHPSIELVKNALNRLSPSCRDKFIENFLVNASILGYQKQIKLEEEIGCCLPWTFVISLTSKCNLNCNGCYAGEYARNKDLSFEEVDRILTEAKELGMYFVTFLGGEPLIWPDILKIFEKHNDMIFQVITYGTFINKELAMKLSKLGNVILAISIEGFEKETDERRGKGVFKKIMQAMGNLKEAGILFGFSSTATKYNSEIFVSDEFIDLMISRGCLYCWYFQYVPLGRKPDVSLMATPEQRNKLRLKVKEIRNTKPLFIGDFWHDGLFTGGCVAGARSNGYFHINCNGDVEPCVFLQFSVDNIKGKKLIDVIQSPFFKAIQGAQPYCKNKNLIAPCALIDHPEILRRLVKEFNAKPSYSGGGDVVSDLKVTKFLDNYSKEFKNVTDPIWENELSCNFKHWKEHERFRARMNSKKVYKSI